VTASEAFSILDGPRSQWIDAVHSGDAQRYAELVTEQVVWVPPDGRAIVGRDAFRAWVKPFFDAVAYDFTLHPEHVMVKGDWAIERGAFLSTVRTRAGGSRSTHGGHYTVIWQRRTDSQWRIDRYFDTTEDEFREAQG
jgi:uncharacterized protein (TIGR02246 family)